MRLDVVERVLEARMMPARRAGVRIPLRERTELARRAHAFAEAGAPVWHIALMLAVSQPTAVNLIGYGRRLAAGQPEVLEWPPARR